MFLRNNTVTIPGKIMSKTTYIKKYLWEFAHYISSKVPELNNNEKIVIQIKQIREKIESKIV